MTRNPRYPVLLALVALALVAPQAVRADAPMSQAEFLASMAVPAAPAQPDLFAPEPTQAANCGGFTCSSTQSCYYCGTSLSCQPTGSSCCSGGTRFCSPSQICLYCNVGSTCQPPGTTCCGGSPCQPPHSCHSGGFCY